MSSRKAWDNQLCDLDKYCSCLATWLHLLDDEDCEKHQCFPNVLFVHKSPGRNVLAMLTFKLHFQRIHTSTWTWRTRTFKCISDGSFLSRTSVLLDGILLAGMAHGVVQVGDHSPGLLPVLDSLTPISHVALAS